MVFSSCSPARTARCQRGPIIGVCHGGESQRALARGEADEGGRPVLGDDVVDLRLRGGAEAGPSEAADNPRPSPGGSGRKGQHRAALDAAVRATEEVGLASCPGHSNAVDVLGVHLSVQIDLERRVDGPEPRDSFQGLLGVRL